MKNLIIICLIMGIWPSVEAQVIGYDEMGLEIISIKNFTISTKKYLKSKKSLRFKEFVDQFNEYREKSSSPIKVEKEFDWLSDEDMTLMHLDGMLLHVEGFERNELGSTEITNDNIVLHDKEGNRFYVGMDIKCLEKLYPKSFYESHQNPNARDKIIFVSDGVIDKKQVIRFDAHLYFNYDKISKKVTSIEYWK